MSDLRRPDANLSFIQAPGAPPAAGPYSHAVRLGGLVFAAGQGPFDAEGQLVGATFTEQANQVFDNLAAVARAAGTDLSRTVRLGVFLKDLANFQEMNRIVRDRFGPRFPARTTVQSNLPGFEIEVDAVFAAGDEGDDR
jgi:2-iminobutanoate/2-iminopropanoate deaminase